MESIVSTDTLPKMGVGPAGSFATFFHGDHHDVKDVSLMLGELQPGEGPPLHRHSYDELFVIHEGIARFTINGNTFVATTGQIVVARSGEPHSFQNSGASLLKVTAIHAAPKVVIEWVEAPPA